MNSAFRVITICSLFLKIGSGQTSLEAFEHFAKRPTARIVWSKEVDHIDTDRAHAVITALIVEDAKSNPSRMRGVRIDLSEGDVKDQVYTSEDLMERLTNGLNEIADGLPYFLSRGWTSSNRCFGSGVFWQQTGHAFSASSCFIGDWYGLSVNTGNGSFRFTGIQPSSFVIAIGRAKDELN
jgi:hypothetical protein